MRIEINQRKLIRKVGEKPTLCGLAPTKIATAKHPLPRQRKPHLQEAHSAVLLFLKPFRDKTEAGLSLLGSKEINPAFAKFFSIVLTVLFARFRVE
jgi:hypothetical protein